VRTTILAEGDRLSGLHRPIAIRGGERDDVIVVTFDLRNVSAELRFDDEIDMLTDTSAALVESSTCTPVVLERPVPIIDNRAPTDGGEKWIPITSAPVEQNLKVRLEDSMGRYVLLFPCKLIPGRGWINSWLETPLAGDPVDWCDWDEPPVEF
jgi:hypothetical protein